MKKNNYICSVQARTIIALLGAGILFSAYIVRYNNGLTIPDGFCTVRSEIVLAELGIAQPIFCAVYYSFSFMARTMKNAVNAQGASYAASAHETSISTQSVAQVVNPLFIDVLNQLGDIKNQLTENYLSSKLLQELCDTEFFELDPLFYDIACKIGAMAQAEMIDNTLFNQIGEQSNE